MKRSLNDRYFEYSWRRKRVQLADGTFHSLKNRKRWKTLVSNCRIVNDVISKHMAKDSTAKVDMVLYI